MQNKISTMCKKLNNFLKAGSFLKAKNEMQFHKFEVHFLLLYSILLKNLR